MYFEFRITDTLGIAWQQPSYPVSEANSFVEVCVQSTGALERSVDITISTVPDTATGKLPQNLIGHPISLVLDEYVLYLGESIGQAKQAQCPVILDG